MKDAIKFQKKDETRIGSGMKVLITGIAGFVGSHLAELLLEKGEEVFGIKLPDESLENIRHIEKNLHLADCDITDLAGSFCKKDKPDEIYHLAALAQWERPFLSL